MLQIYIYSDSGNSVPEEQFSQITSHIIVENIQRVLAAITGVIRAGAEDGCSIEVINTASVRPQPLAACYRSRM